MQTTPLLRTWSLQRSNRRTTRRTVQVPNLDSTREAAKLAALRSAADSGIAAIERGECREFSSMDDLVAYLNRMAKRAILAVKRRSR
jgi:hypothetical protein